jgi:hypothetical protein
MKGCYFLFLFLLIGPNIFSQEYLHWDDLNAPENEINNIAYIIFSDSGHLKINDNSKLFDVSKDTIQIQYSENKVIFYYKNDKDSSDLIMGQFELKFNGTSKNFKFSLNNIIKPEIDIDSQKTKKSFTTTYYSALQLYGFYKDKKYCEVNSLLDKLIVAETNNVFLSTIRKPCEEDSVSLSSSVRAVPGELKTKGILSSIGGLDVTKYADGLAKFLVKRTKEELTISFFDKFRKELNDSKDLRVLFPRTQKSLGRIDEIFDYSRYLNLLKESYHHDFLNLPEKIDELISGNPEIDTTLKAGVSISTRFIQGLRDKEHPGEILSSMAVPAFNDDHDTIKYSFVLLQSLSEALRDTLSADDSPYWVEKSKIMELTRNEEFLKIFLGLLIEDERIKSHDELYNLLNDSSRWREYIPVFVELSDVSQAVSSLIKLQKGEENLSNETISKYIENGIRLLKISNKIYRSYKGNPVISPDFDRYLSTIELGNSIYGSIATKKYSSAIFNLIDLIDTIPELKNDKTIKWLMKYGSFMASTIEADNSDEVVKIIETYAMPSGSSRVKRNSKYNISLNSYLGIYAGTENSQTVYGIAAPVGIAFSHGGKCGSISLFFSAIDIGAISSFRFNNNEDDVAKIFLKEIISPGAFVSYGIRNNPISINLGIQKTPLLTRVGANKNEVDISHNTRISLSVLVDIPLLNIYNK